MYKILLYKLLLCLLFSTVYNIPYRYAVAEDLPEQSPTEQLNKICEDHEADDEKSPEADSDDAESGEAQTEQTNVCNAGPSTKCCKDPAKCLGGKTLKDIKDANAFITPVSTAMLTVLQGAGVQGMAEACAGMQGLAGTGKAILAAAAIKCRKYIYDCTSTCNSIIQDECIDHKRVEAVKAAQKEKELAQKVKNRVQALVDKIKNIPLPAGAQSSQILQSLKDNLRKAKKKLTKATKKLKEAEAKLTAAQELAVDGKGDPLDSDKPVEKYLANIKPELKIKTQCDDLSSVTEDMATDAAALGATAITAEGCKQMAKAQKRNGQKCTPGDPTCDNTAVAPTVKKVDDDIIVISAQNGPDGNLNPNTAPNNNNDDTDSTQHNTGTGGKIITPTLNSDNSPTNSNSPVDTDSSDTASGTSSGIGGGGNNELTGSDSLSSDNKNNNPYFYKNKKNNYGSSSGGFSGYAKQYNKRNNFAALGISKNKMKALKKQQKTKRTINSSRGLHQNIFERISKQIHSMCYKILDCR